MTHTPTPWDYQEVEDLGPDLGAVFIIGGFLDGIVGAALPFPSECESGDFSRVIANAEFITRAANSHDSLLAALKSMIAAIDASSIDSETLPGDMDSGIAPYKWHQEWAHHARQAIADASHPTEL